METVLQARGLAKTYSGDGIDVLALRGVDLDVAEGEFVAVMGPSGCGTSTLLHLLGGLDRPTAGSITLGGRPVDSLSEAEWAVPRRREIGFVFQVFNLVGNLTVAENVEQTPPLIRSADGRLRRRQHALPDLAAEHCSIEIGWTWLAPTAWSTGANVQAKLLMLEHALERWGCRRVELKTDALNERSRGALEALGATFEGVHRKHVLVRGGENRDSAWYSVLDDEWPGVRELLLVRLGRI